MRKLSILVAATTILLTSAAHAAFLLEAPSPPSQAPIPLARSVRHVAPAAHRAPLKFEEAKGFGHAVPLSLAVGQMVPADWAKEFGPNVALETPVDWKGGRPWNVVLKDAVEPLGLKLTFAANRVLIQK